jgi:hypothetical protein
VYYGDMDVRKVSAKDNELTSSLFLVGQIVGNVSESMLTINYYITGEAVTRYLPHTEERMVPFVAARTGIYQQCDTNDFASMAYIVHGEDTSNLLIHPEGILNTFTVVQHLLIVNSEPTKTPYPQCQHFAASEDVHR